jgi:polyisoprenoid-binding protein YceI
MKKGFIVFVAMLVTGITYSQSYQPLEEKSTVKFTIKNFGVNTGGSFKGPQGTIIFDPSDLSKSSFDVSVPAETINTDNESRDKHLKGEDYFSVKEYPSIIFKSDKVEGNAKKGYTVKGKLTMKGTTKEIAFPFSAVQQGADWLFSGEIKLNRRDFKVGGNSAVLSDNLVVLLTVLATRK